LRHRRCGIRLDIVFIINYALRKLIFENHPSMQLRFMCSPHDEPINEDGLSLSDAISTSDSLLFVRGIVFEVEHDNSVSSVDVKTNASCSG